MLVYSPGGSEDRAEARSTSAGAPFPRALGGGGFGLIGTLQRSRGCPSSSPCSLQKGNGLDARGLATAPPLPTGPGVETVAAAIAFACSIGGAAETLLDAAVSIGAAEPTAETSGAAETS